MESGNGMVIGFEKGRREQFQGKGMDREQENGVREEWGVGPGPGNVSRRRGLSSRLDPN